MRYNHLVVPAILLAACGGSVDVEPNLSTPSSVSTWTVDVPTPSPEETVEVTPEETVDKPDLPTVHPGAFCKTIGARGVSKKKVSMKCTLRPGEDTPRWRRS